MAAAKFALVSSELASCQHCRSFTTDEVKTYLGSVFLHFLQNGAAADLILGKDLHFPSRQLRP
jgi:hypothetical protein